MSVTKKYPNVERYKDRHGCLRYYYRKAGRRRVPLLAPFGTVEFDLEYHAAASATGPEPGASRTQSGTVDALCVAYYKSADFKSLRPATQELYRRHIDKFRQTYGTWRVAAINKKHMRALKDEYWDTPGAARNMLKRLQTLFNFAIEEDLISVNPMTGVRLPPPGDGFLEWTDEDIAAYLKHWGKGTRERLGLYLLLYTGQRRSDVVGMGGHAVKDGEILVVQQKTGARLWIPLHQTLADELALHPDDQAAFLIDRRTGLPLSSAGFGNWIREAAKTAGIEGTRGPHGLRKAACRRLIEAGCDAETARSISGHTDDGQLKVYIKGVNQRKMARRAIGKLPNPVA